MKSFENCTVLELASVLAGPSVAMFFAELGARVIKIENPRTGGDVTRSWKLPSEPAESDISAYFSAVNWGKSSLALDLTLPEGRETVYQLAARADIVISSYIPGADKKLGVDAATLLNINPSLICAEISGYGPEEERAAFDAIIQAEAGYTWLNGEAGQMYKMPVALMDVLAAHQLKEAILLAWIRRMETGKGGRVHVSLLQAGISALVNQATNYLQAGVVPQAIGSDHPNIVPYGTLFDCQDGQIVLAVGNDAQFAGLCEVLQLPLPEEFSSNRQRVARREEVKAWLRPAFAGWQRDPLLAALRSRKVPAGAVNDMAAVFAQPQAQALVLRESGYAGIRGFVGEGFERHTLSAPPELGAGNS
ncbi:MAG: CoA transferase [Bacteroidetes bacterium]|nr:MAG: CoA transferase [Bacteroidota bacterium]